MPARPRVIMLGASNLTRGVSTAIETARLVVDEPIEIVCALGHGRSYGSRSTVCGRSLPGILECGLWEHELWESLEPGAPTYALVTDIGNDLMYGQTPETVAGWVEACLDRMNGLVPGHDTRTVVTALPIDAIRGLRPSIYRVIKALLFPGRPISYRVALERAERLHELVLDLVERRGAVLVRPDPGWYGLDPIHIRMRSWPAAWSSMLTPWSGNQAGGGPPVIARRSMSRWIRLRTATAHRWWLLGRPLGRIQPARRFMDGTTVGLY